MNAFTRYETDEDFRLVFSNPTHARLDETAAQVVIGNDDKPPAVIDLGKNYGKLIQPVQVDGDHYFYFWDVSGDGVANPPDGNTHPTMASCSTTPTTTTITSPLRCGEVR